MDYKPTTNYVKAQSKYNLDENRRAKLLNSILGLKSMYSYYDSIATDRRKAKYGREVATHFTQGQMPEWIKKDYVKPLQTMQRISGYEGDTGLWGALKNFYNPTAQHKEALRLGNLASSQNTSDLISSPQNMSPEAVSAGTQTTAGSIASNPITPILATILALGYGAGKEGSTINRWNNKLRGLV